MAISLSPIPALLAAALGQPCDSPRIDPVPPSRAELQPDAAEVARGDRPSEAEAARRLRLQEVSASHVSKLRREFSDRLAGLYLESEGDYRIVLRLKGAEPVPDRWIGSGGDRMRIQFLAGAPATLEETLEKVADSMAAIGARLPGLMGVGVDERTGEVLLDVQAAGEEAGRARAAEARLERLLGNPVRLLLSSSALSDGRPPSRPLPNPPKPGTREWDGHMQRLARSARYPGAPNPEIRRFHYETRPLIQRVRADPAFAGWVFVNGNEPYAVVLFTGDAAVHLARYTRDPRYRPKSAALTHARLLALQDGFGKLLRQLEIHYTFSSADEGNNRVTFSVSEMDKYQGAVEAGRVKPHPNVLVVQDQGPIARSPQSSGAVKHFPQFKFPGRLMDAALAGTLELKHGCLVIGSNLILWPSGAKLTAGSDGVPTVAGGSGAPLRVGDQVRIGGGEAWTNFSGEGLLQSVPAECSGRYWIAGEY
ncbi:MAG TPA: hypothetical protein VF535_02365 [Allosphingosinicella sp.]|jgi:hypothetical protein